MQVIFIINKMNQHKKLYTNNTKDYYRSDNNTTAIKTTTLLH